MEPLIIGPDGKAVLPQPHEISEREKSDAMGAYLMMFAALILGLPLPFLNIIAAIIYFAVNKKSRFVVFHSYQSLISQIFVSLVNALLIVVFIGLSIQAAIAEAFDFLPFYWIPLGAFSLIAVILNVLYVVYSIIGCIKANKGIIYYMPVFGKISFEKYYGVKAAREQESGDRKDVNAPPR
jgi:uncharacterized Tic20 family protein